MSNRMACLALALMLAACGGTEPTGEATLSLSETSVRPEPGAVLTAELTNSSDRTLYLTTCGNVAYVELERRVGARWERLSSPLCAAVFVSTREALLEGQTRTLTQRLPDSLATGMYRLRVPLSDAPANGERTEATAEFGIGS